MKIKCIIGHLDDEGKWEEELNVSCLDKAEVEVKNIVKKFNSSLRGNEKPRKFIKLLEEVAIVKDLRYYLDIALKFLGDIGRENQNLYGNRWLKECYYTRVQTYDKMLETGKSRYFKKFMDDCIQKRATDYNLDLWQEFLGADIDKLIKEKRKEGA